MKWIYIFFNIVLLFFIEKNASVNCLPSFIFHFSTKHCLQHLPSQSPAVALQQKKKNFTSFTFKLLICKFHFLPHIFIGNFLFFLSFRSFFIGGCCSHLFGLFVLRFWCCNSPRRTYRSVVFSYFSYFCCEESLTMEREASAQLTILALSSQMKCSWENKCAFGVEQLILKITVCVWDSSDSWHLLQSPFFLFHISVEALSHQVSLFCFFCFLRFST